MKNLILGLFLFCGTAGAQQPAPAAPAPAHGGKYYEEIMQAVKYLAVLVDRNAEIPAERMDALAPEISSFTARVKAAIGEKILTEMARKEKEAEDKARSVDAEKTLQAFRAALQVYYTEEGGRYPKNPAVLVPRLMAVMPKVHLPEHAQTDKIAIIDSKKPLLIPAAGFISPAPTLSITACCCSTAPISGRTGPNSTSIEP